MLSTNKFTSAKQLTHIYFFNSISGQYYYNGTNSNQPKELSPTKGKFDDLSLKLSAFRHQHQRACDKNMEEAAILRRIGKQLPRMEKDLKLIFKNLDK